MLVKKCLERCIKMKDKLYQEMYKKYKQGYSCRKIGKMYGLRGCSVCSGFKAKRRQFKLRTKKTLPFITYDNIKFTINPDGYYYATNGNREKLHRYIWEKHKGKIPKGYHVHHLNNNKTDNRIENLECSTNSCHIKKYHNQICKNRKRDDKGRFL